jgi:uncharacterized protein (TIGR02996 family)
LLSAVADDPDEDAPRLVLADWLEEHDDPARAEFIRVQCTLARLPEGDVRQQVLSERQDELLERHAADWRAGAPSGWEVAFERGLLTVSMSPPALLRRRGAAWWDALGAWVTTLNLWECDDATLRRLTPRFGRLAGLRFLRLYTDGARVTDHGAEALAELRQLSVLDLWSSAVTDAGLRAMAGLSRLQDLNLNSTAVTDEGLKVVGRFKRLVRLSLIATSVTDEGLRALAGLRHLEDLNLLACAGVRGEGLAFLARLSRLEDLSLGRCRVGDASLKHLLGLKRLRWLNLEDTDVTDSGLRQLVGLRRLQALLLGRAGKRCTQAGVAALREALPQCTIHHYR